MNRETDIIHKIKITRIRIREVCRIEIINNLELEERINNLEPEEQVEKRKEMKEETIEIIEIIEIIGIIEIIEIIEIEKIISIIREMQDHNLQRLQIKSKPYLRRNSKSNQEINHKLKEEVEQEKYRNDYDKKKH